MATQTQTGLAEPELESLLEDTSSLTVVLYLGRLSLNQSSPFQLSKLNISLPPALHRGPFGLGECVMT